MTAFGMISQSRDDQESGPVERSPVGPAPRLISAPERIAPRPMLPQGGVFRRLLAQPPRPPAAPRLIAAPEGIAPRPMPPQSGVFRKFLALAPRPPAAPAISPFKQRIAPVMADGPVKGESIIVPSLPPSQTTFVAPKMAAPVLPVAAPAPGVQIQVATIQGPGLKTAPPVSLPEPRPASQEAPATDYQPKGPGFFDQELIPGVKNLYLAAATGGLLLLLLVMGKRK